MSWRYRSPADQAAAVLGSDNLSGQLPDGQFVRPEPTVDLRYLRELVRGCTGSAALPRTLHGSHCFDPDGTLVCGWPDEHPETLPMFPGLFDHPLGWDL
jgi:hypothetical protein